jgi:hypothetical protein
MDTKSRDEKINAILDGLIEKPYSYHLQKSTELGDYFLTYIFDEFFIETHRSDELVRIECVSRDVAFFSLT